MTSPENPLKTQMSSPVKSIMKIDLRRPPVPSPPAVGSQGLRSQEAGSQGLGSQESGGLSAQREIADSRSQDCSPPAVGSQGLGSQESGGLSAQRRIANSRSQDSSPPPRRQPPCLLTLAPLTSPPLTISHPPKGPKPCPRPS